MFFYLQPEWMPLRLAHQHLLDWATQLDIQIAHVDLSLLTSDFVDLLHQQGIGIHASNLDAVEQMKQGLSLGINGFSTGRLTTALEARNRGEPTKII